MTLFANDDLTWTAEVGTSQAVVGNPGLSVEFSLSGTGGDKLDVCGAFETISGELVGVLSEARSCIEDIFGADTLDISSVWPSLVEGLWLKFFI